jgi:hypothetical protein
MKYWFLGVSFIIGCAILSGPKFIELGADMGGGGSGPSPDRVRGAQQQRHEQKQERQQQGPQGNSHSIPGK